MDSLKVPFEDDQISPEHRKRNAVVDVPQNGVNISWFGSYTKDSTTLVVKTRTIT